MVFSPPLSMMVVASGFVSFDVVLTGVGVDGGGEGGFSRCRA